MFRSGWGPAALLGLWVIGGRPSCGPPSALQVRSLEVVDDAGHVVARLQPTATGAELVLGGLAQVSLVTDREVAAVNLIGSEGVARVVAGQRGHVVLLPEAD